MNTSQQLYAATMAMLEKLGYTYPQQRFIARATVRAMRRIIYQTATTVTASDLTAKENGK